MTSCPDHCSLHDRLRTYLKIPLHFYFDNNLVYSDTIKSIGMDYGLDYVVMDSGQGEPTFLPVEGVSLHVTQIEYRMRHTLT